MGHTTIKTSGADWKRGTRGKNSRRACGHKNKGRERRLKLKRSEM